MTFVFTSPWNFYLNPKYFLFVSFFFEVRTYNCYCLKGNVSYSSFQKCNFFILSSRTLGEIGCWIRLQYLLTNFSYYHYHLPFSSSACMKMWKLETTAKGNIVYVSLYKQKGNSWTLFWTHLCRFFFFFLPLCWIIYVTNEQFHQNQTIWR